MLSGGDGGTRMMGRATRLPTTKRGLQAAFSFE
jgi:hypothetical protein